MVKTKHGKKKQGKRPPISNKPITKGVTVLGKNQDINTKPITEGVKIVNRD